MKLSYDIVLPPNGGTKDANPVILLHGRMDSKNTWKRFAPEIARRTGREVFAVDARNHGDSPWTDEMTLGHLVLDLDEFMTDQGITRAVLVGHSMGGRTAMTYALKMPQKVEKLFVEDMVAGKYGDIAKRSVHQIMLLLRESLSAVPPGADEVAAKTIISDFVQKNMPPTRPGKKASRLFEPDTIAIKKEGDRYVWKANLDALEKMLWSDKVVEELSGVFTGETLFLYGTDSVFDVEQDEKIREFFPCAAKIPVEGAGHLIHQDFPVEYLEQVVNFINK